MLKFISKYLWTKKRIIYSKGLKVHPLEIKFDTITNAPCVTITPTTKFKPHEYQLEDLLEDNNLLNKLEDQSYKYVFYAYGMLKATEKNNIFVLVELLLLNKEIKVKNLQTLKLEEWNKEKFEKHYAFLDKKSLKISSEFFQSIQQPPKHNAYSDNDNFIAKLKLVK